MICYMWSDLTVYWDHVEKASSGSLDIKPVLLPLDNPFMGAWAGIGNLLVTQLLSQFSMYCAYFAGLQSEAYLAFECMLIIFLPVYASVRCVFLHFSLFWNVTVSDCHCQWHNHAPGDLCHTYQVSVPEPVDLVGWVCLLHWLSYSSCQVTQCYSHHWGVW